MLDLIQTIALQNDAGGLLAGLGLIIFLIFLLFALIPLAGLWKIFTKAGEPGWAAIIPLYNFIVLLRITDNPIWYVILAFIPLVNLFISIKVLIDLADAFGKGAGYAIGMFILPIIFIPLLGFGSAQYRHPGGGAPGGRPAGQPR